MVWRWIIALISYLTVGCFTQALAQSVSTDQKQKAQIQIDQLANSCQSQQKKDKLCEAIIQLREIGADTIEAVKQFANLTPTQYALLTAANSVANGRIRVRTKSHFGGEGSDVLDIQKESVTLIIERQMP